MVLDFPSSYPNLKSVHVAIIVSGPGSTPSCERTVPGLLSTSLRLRGVRSSTDRTNSSGSMATFLYHMNSPALCPTRSASPICFAKSGWRATALRSTVAKYWHARINPLPFRHTAHIDARFVERLSDVKWSMVVKGSRWLLQNVNASSFDVRCCHTTLHIRRLVLCEVSTSFERGTEAARM